jgi:hypothetical protein
MDVESARLLPWEAEQAAADALASAALSWADVADARAHGPALQAPFDGILHHPGGNVLIQLDSLDTRWVQVRVPERDRVAWSIGEKAGFKTTDGTFGASGTIVRVGSLSHPSGDVPIVWATLQLDDAAPSGATGVATVTQDGWLQ